MKKQYRVTDTTIYTVRPVVTEYQVRSVERSTPQTSKLANFLTLLLLFPPVCALLSWLLFGEHFSHDEVVTGLVFFAAAWVVQFISQCLARRGR
jgi:hypothetical protein